MREATVRQGRRRPDEGAAAVEFAIVAPLLFMLVFGIIQFGIFFAQDLALSNGAKQGVRVAVVPEQPADSPSDPPVSSGSCGDIVDAVQQGVVTVALAPADVETWVHDSTVDPALRNGASDLCAAPAVRPCVGRPVGTELVVTTNYTASLIIPFFGADTFDLRREGSARCEYNAVMP